MNWIRCSNRRSKVFSVPHSWAFSEHTLFGNYQKPLPDRVVHKHENTLLSVYVGMRHYFLMFGFGIVLGLIFEQEKEFFLID